MKTVAFFSFAFVLVFTATTKSSEYFRLRNIMHEINKTLNGGPEALLDSLVPAGFDEDRCRVNGPEDFCIAEKILSDINYKQYGIKDTLTISRVLKQYNKFHPSKCTVKENADEEQLHDLLTNLYNCAQVIYSRHHPAAHHKRPQQFAEGTDGNPVNSA